MRIPLAAAVMLWTGLALCGTGRALVPAPDLGELAAGAPNVTLVSDKLNGSQKRQELQRRIDDLVAGLERLGFSTIVNRLCSSGDRMFILDVGDGCGAPDSERCARLVVRDAGGAHMQLFRTVSDADISLGSFPAPELAVVVKRRAETLVESSSIDDFVSKTQRLGFIERYIRYLESSLGSSKPSRPQVIDIADTACKER